MCWFIRCLGEFLSGSLCCSYFQEDPVAQISQSTLITPVDLAVANGIYQMLPIDQERMDNT